MTEDTIYKIILDNSTNFNYKFPKLQQEAVNLISETLTDIIYDSFKVKSHSGSVVRGNVLKCLNVICQRKIAHYYTDFSDELDVINDYLDLACDNVVDNDLTEYGFFDKKPARQRDIFNRLEFIKKHDQLRLVSKFNIELKPVVFYESNVEFLKNFLHDPVKINENVVNTSFRYKLIQLAYALLQIKTEQSKCILIKIMRKLLHYEYLDQMEEDFIYYLWCFEDKSCEITNFLIEKYFYILERFIIQHCTDILVDFKDLTKIVVLKQVLKENGLLKLKIKSLIYELYCFSYCNSNILKFMNDLINL